MKQEQILAALLATAALAITTGASADHHEGSGNESANYKCVSECAGKPHGNGCHGKKLEAKDEASCKEMGGIWNAANEKGQMMKEKMKDKADKKKADKKT